MVSEKYGILDINATLNDDTTVDIEMQVTDYGNMIERSLYYSSKLISSQLKSGNDYITLKPVIIVCILNFDLFPFEDYITETVTVSKKHLDYEIIKHQKFYFIELSKFRNNNYDLKEKTNQWLTFIDGMNKKGVEVAMSKNNVIKKAKEELDYLTGNERLQRLAELREKALKDRNSLYNYGHRTGVDEGMKKGVKKGIELGIKQGIEQGIERGIKQGIKQGIEQGEEQSQIKIIKNLINQNFDIDMISKITNLSKEKIKKLIKG